MGLKTALILVAVLVPFSASAGPSTCWLKSGDCKRYIGKRLWVSIPSWNQNVVEITFVKDDWTTARTLKLKSGASFVVTGYVDDPRGGAGDYAVKLNDGRTGWVGASSPFVFDFDPVVREKEERAECDRRGQPKIGMTPAELIETCWRKPRRVVKKTTAAGVEENYVYSLGHIVKVVDGKVTEIIESR